MSTRTAAARRALRGNARRTPRASYLVAADQDQLGELEVVLATLPLCATGRVFVEIDEPTDEVLLQAPARMTVTFLPRSARSGEPGTGSGCHAGTALLRAVSAWAGEMLVAEDPSADTDDAEDVRTRVHILAGYSATADLVEHLVEVRGVEPERIHTPARFGLETAR